MQSKLANERPDSSTRKAQLSKMISIGPFILIAGIAIAILLCWAWLPFFLMAKLFKGG